MSGVSLLYLTLSVSAHNSGPVIGLPIAVLAVELISGQRFSSTFSLRHARRSILSLHLGRAQVGGSFIGYELF